MTTTKTDSTAKWVDQYSHPKWQKKRLEILEYDNYTCQKCGDKESTLHVHHTFYEKERMMWEYERGHLITLCDKCHKVTHAHLDNIKRYGLATSQTNYRVERTAETNGCLLTLEDISTICFITEVCGDESVAYRTLKLAIEMYEAEAELNEANATIESMEVG
jgi:DNA-directed RNA polymerase subunit M/transcription elongation factor TFIIS